MFRRQFRSKGKGRLAILPDPDTGLASFEALEVDTGQVAVYVLPMGKRPANTTITFWRDPELPGVEVRYSDYCEDAFRNHSHETYSIGCLESGRTTFELLGRKHTAKAGQMVLMSPGAVHCCNPDPDSNMAYLMFYVAPKWLETVGREVFGRETVKVSFPSPVLDDPALIAHWRALHEAFMEGSGRLEKESLLLQGIADLLARHAELGEVREAPTNKGAMLRAKAYLDAHPYDKVSLDELAEVAHLSRYHLLRNFQASFGLSPHSYQNQLRVNLGKKLLAGGTSISQAAAETGFADQSHFSRVFKQYTGATPRQYQATQSC